MNLLGKYDNQSKNIIFFKINLKNLDFLSFPHQNKRALNFNLNIILF
jgi:hypothetical protein